MRHENAEKVTPEAGTLTDRMEARLLHLSRKAGYPHYAAFESDLNAPPAVGARRRVLTLIVVLTVQAAVVSGRFTWPEIQEAYDDFCLPVAQTPPGRALQRARGILARMVGLGLGRSTEGLPSWHRLHTEGRPA